VKRVAVVGCGGSGKTTLARELGARLGIEVVHLDGLYYRADWSTTPPEEWKAVQRRLVAQPSWIIEGNYGSTMPDRVAAADTIIYLDLSTGVCLWSVLRRRLKFRGRSRPDLGVYDRINWQFIRFILSFRRTRRPLILAQIDEHKQPGSTVVRLMSRRAANQFVRGAMADADHAARYVQPDSVHMPLLSSGGRLRSARSGCVRQRGR
jgi:adenylate kinase family enzyme